MPLSCALQSVGVYTTTTTITISTYLERGFTIIIFQHTSNASSVTASSICRRIAGSCAPSGARRSAAKARASSASPRRTSSRRRCFNSPNRSSLKEIHTRVRASCIDAQDRNAPAPNLLLVRGRHATRNTPKFLRFISHVNTENLQAWEKVSRDTHLSLSSMVGSRSFASFMACTMFPCIIALRITVQYTRGIGRCR